MSSRNAASREYGVGSIACDNRHAPMEMQMVKQLKKTKKTVSWTKAMHAELRRHSKAKTPVAKISKLMKRTVGALRQQAIKLGIGLGHRR